MAGIGFDAHIASRFATATRRGFIGYAGITARALTSYVPQRYRVTTGGVETAHRAILVTIANSAQFGNNARIAPGARVDDGMLDLVAVSPVGLIGAALLAVRMFTGTFDESRHVRRLRGRRFVIDRVAPGLIHTDGETHPAGARVEVVVHPRSLRVLVPFGSRAASRPVDPAPAGLAAYLP